MRCFVLLSSLLLVCHVAFAGIFCDGTNDFLLGTNENIYDFVDQTWTVCTKFATTTAGSTRLIVAKGNGNPRWYLQLLSAGTVQAGFKNAAGEDIGYRPTIATVHDGVLHSLCAVYTSHSTTRDSNVVTLYVDGVLSQGAHQHFGSGGFAQNSDNINMCRLGAGSNLFIGTIEEVVIWCGDIGATAALQYHENGIKRTQIANPLISYWPLWDCAAGATCTTFADEGRTSTLTATGVVGTPMAIPLRGDIQ